MTTALQKPRKHPSEFSLFERRWMHFCVIGMLVYAPVVVAALAGLAVVLAEVKSLIPSVILAAAMIFPLGLAAWMFDPPFFREKTKNGKRRVSLGGYFVKGMALLYGVAAMALFAAGIIAYQAEDADAFEWAPRFGAAIFLTVCGLLCYFTGDGMLTRRKKEEALLQSEPELPGAK